ncbi:LamG-like jellyroll fold domain-containing protein [Streptomyces nogalater]
MLNAVSSAYQPWTSTEGLQIGRSRVGGVWGEYFRGRIDEVSVWQYALSPEQIAEEAQLTQDGAPTSELVAYWDAASSTGTQVKELSPPVPELSLSSTGAVLDADNNALALDGKSGYASASGPVADETGSFTVSARVSWMPRSWRASLSAMRPRWPGRRSAASPPGHCGWSSRGRHLPVEVHPDRRGSGRKGQPERAGASRTLPSWTPGSMSPASSTRRRPGGGLIQPIPPGPRTAW